MDGNGGHRPGRLNLRRSVAPQDIRDADSCWPANKSGVYALSTVDPQVPVNLTEHDQHELLCMRHFQGSPCQPFFWSHLPFARPLSCPTASAGGKVAQNPNSTTGSNEATA
jgi:hypothetical protein